MRIFYSFLILVTSTILILLPVTSGIYDFRTDVQQDTFSTTTAVGSDNTTVQLIENIYEHDISTVTITSDDTDDSPVPYSYNNTNRALIITGLTANNTRSLIVDYDVNAFTEAGLSTFLDYLPWVWILIWVAFPVAGLVAIWMGKA